MHDRELTYSLTLPKIHHLAGDAQTLYKAVHNAIIAVLRGLLPPGTRPMTIRSFQEKSEGKCNEAQFLCFKRRFQGDIVLVDQTAKDFAVDHKIVGSAQRRSRGAVLQHGSILLSRSQRSPELAGLGDLCDNDFVTSCLISELSKQILESVGLEVSDRTLSNQAFALASALQDEKYRNRLWTQRR